MREIKVRINKLTGKVTIEAAGFSGKSCEAATKAFEEAIGKVDKRTPKDDYYKEQEGGEFAYQW